MPTELVGSGRKRLFEGTRLLFGFLFEKAKSVRLHSSQLQDEKTWPYLGAFQTTQLRDVVTQEAVVEPVQTQNGMVERNYHQAFSAEGPLSSSTMQSAMMKEQVESTLFRHAIMSGGVNTQAEIITFSRESLRGHYTYADGGDIAAIADDSELNELHYLAELCGRNKLAVHRPNQLTSAVSPCLTFDRNAHVAVYLGEQGCGEPGRSSLVFRPLSGTETVDTATITMLIAPILKTYEAEGTGVFDASGGAALRNFEAPDEVLMFVVDCSASTKSATDFEEVNEDDVSEAHATTAHNNPLQPTVEGEFYTRARYEDIKEDLCKHESFTDMVAMVADASEPYRPATA